ncbi:regucalcin-like [Bicyclus anynana]|uniref:Regucalcin-like n=1 Tax=Bicyclus anynana TaxID=110368 RepID=A0A6J1P9X7_BICAN|nr:regucalcin-like [Bicyclus anynana]
MNGNTFIDAPCFKTTVNVVPIVSSLELGEAPHWDPWHQALFFVNILQGYIHKYELATKRHTKTKLAGRVGFIVPVEGTRDQYVVGVERTFVVVRWDGEEGSPASVVRELATVDKDVMTTAINDGKADPRGRLYAGTMSDKPIGTLLQQQAAGLGSFYRLDDNGITKLDDGIGISNGLAWDLKKRAMYYTDSLEFKIRKYDYDVETGEISNPKYIFDISNNSLGAVQDGTTIDSNGNLWVALLKGYGVIQIDPNGKILQRVDIPARQVTSVAFGGPNYDILFVTTGCMDLNDGVIQQGSCCGCTFMVTGLGVKGLPADNFRLSDRFKPGPTKGSKAGRGDKKEKINKDG